MQKHHILFTLPFFLLLASSACAQPDSLWTSTVVGNGNTILNCATTLPDGGFVVAGYSAGQENNSDFFVARLASNGSVIWSDNYAVTTASEEVNGVVVVRDTIFAVGYGQGEHTDPGVSSVFLFALNLNGTLLWSRTYDPSGMSKARDVTLLNDGNLGVIGYRLGSGNRSDAWFLKCTLWGDTLWTKTYGNTSTDIGQRLKEMPDGNILLFCNTKTGDSDRYDFWPLIVDPIGAVISETSFGTDYEEVGYGVWIENDGSISLVGKQVTLSGTAGYAVSLPAEGEGWEQVYSDDGDFEELHGILFRDSGTLCVGRVGASSAQTYPFMLGLDHQGNRVWSWEIGETGGGNILNGIISVPSDGGGLAYGAYAAGGILRGYVMRIAPPTGVAGIVTELDTGNPLAGVRISASGQNRYTFSDQNGAFALELAAGTYDLMASGPCVESDTLFSIAIPEEGQTTADFELGVPHLASGQSSVNMIAFNHLQSNGIFRLTNTGSGTMAYLLNGLCINPPGNWMSLSSYAGTVPAGETDAVTVTVTPDTSDNGTFAYYGMLIVTTNSCPDTVRTIPVLISVMDTDAPSNTVQEFGLSAVYPNPFNNEASIRFGLEQPGVAALKIYDITGREVAVVADDIFAAGVHTVSFSLPNAASGLYLVQLQSDKQSDIRKVALIK
ncbi:T9SS type A sorting domain-containing protein [bacterium]|nr:T9SS type A sorting domain-containing protein [bacterium]